MTVIFCDNIRGCVHVNISVDRDLVLDLAHKKQPKQIIVEIHG